MVRFAIVSHSENLTKNVMELTSIIVPNIRIAPAGGMDDGDFGTNPEKIQAAIESVYSNDGVLVLVDLGSTITTMEMVIEMSRGKKVEMVGCPLTKGTVVAIIDSVGGMSFEDIRTALAGVGRVKKS